MSQDKTQLLESESDSEQEQTVNPFLVASKGAIDYEKLTRDFGCDQIDGTRIEKWERVTGVKAHPWLRRGIFYAHQDLDKILDDYANGIPIYLYTGRGPSSEAMHMGHMVPFLFTKYLQDALQAVLVIQMSDDEKYSFKGKADGNSLEYYNELTYKNAKDIIACGFNPDKTFIFSNLTTLGGELYANAVKTMGVTGNQVRGIYGLNLDNTIGQLAWPAFQCAPAISSSFPDILHPDGPYSEPRLDGSKVYTGKHLRCLVPMALDQSPYFRMARDHADKFGREGVIKPSTILSKFLVGMHGISGKMSSTGDMANTTIYMTDDPKSIEKKIKKHAFSGGGDTLELHQKFGGNLDEDVSYQWLTYFLDDDKELEEIAHAYRNGTMMTGQIKTKAATAVCNMITEHQQRRAEITDDVVRLFFNRNRQFDLGRVDRPPLELLPTETYATYGSNFDINFGTAPYVEPTEEEKEKVLSEANKKALSNKLEKDLKKKFEQNNTDGLTFQEHTTAPIPSVTEYTDTASV